MKKKYLADLNFNFFQNNYDKDSEGNFHIISNNINKNDKKEEEFISFQKKLNMEEKTEFNRISNLKDNELTLEDKLQIQEQIKNDNDNDDQIEVIENILNNFGKEKYKNNKFLMYKNRNKNKFKSNSVINRNNKILNKIKNDITLINFQQEINKIHKLHNYKIFLKSERAHFNSLKKNRLENNFYENKNKKRIEDIKKKLFNKNKETKNSNNITNKKNEIRKLINNFNIKRKKERFNNLQKENGFNHILEEINNLKEMKINNFNNNFCKTSRARINSDYIINANIKDNNNDILENKKQENDSTKKKERINENEEYLKTEDSTNISIYNSNQFFYEVYKNAIKKYPYLHLLKNKINKMKNNDISKGINKLKEINKKGEKNKSLLDKINSQKNIFQKEIEKYNSK